MFTRSQFRLSATIVNLLKSHQIRIEMCTYGNSDQLILLVPSITVSSVYISQYPPPPDLTIYLF